MNRVLMIAYHYPPQHGSSGLQRTLSFGNYLPEFGWEPIVLTAHPRAYPAIDNGQVGDISKNIRVYRAFALDTSRHLSINGRYSRLMALPDPFVTWWLGAVPKALYLIKKYRPDVIWTTYPIATAHLIGISIHKLTGIPWIADFRDSMTESNYPRDRRKKKVYQWIERCTVKLCTTAVFTTPGAVEMYSERYPDLPKNRWVAIGNGYDENLFRSVEEDLASTQEDVKKSTRIVLVHSGILYPDERDPQCFFSAVSELKREGKIDAEKINIVLRATGHDTLYQGMLIDFDISDIVSLEPSIAYRDAFREMLSSDGLIIFQASSCNHQIPAKAYEYLRAGKPVLALTDPNGDTARMLNDWGIAQLAPLDDKISIKDTLINFIRQIKSGENVFVSNTIVESHSRRSATKHLADLLKGCLVQQGY